MGGGEVDDLLVYGGPAICPFRSADTRLFGICGDEGVERLSFAEPGSPCLEIVGRSATRIGFADPAIIAVIAHSEGNIADTRQKGLVEKHAAILRSEEHTSELQSLMRISYDVFCLKK